MANFIRSDLEFILEQIRIAEAHAAGTPLQQLIANPTLSLGLRTVDGSDNNLVAGQSDFGSADTLFPRMTTPDFREAEAGTSYEQTSGLVIDSQPRTISNLIVDQTDANPAAVAADDADGTSDDVIGNVTPDAGLSAPYNSWFTLFGQFFDHGLDLVTKGGGTVFIPLQPDDPLYVEGSPTNFMVLTRATNQPGPDGVLGTSDDVREHTNTTTPFVDQNQTYTSHPSHQVFLREYVRDGDGRPVATGRLIENRDPGPDGIYYTEDDVETGGLATWAVVKAQASALLGIELYDGDVVNVPLLATDAYGNFLPGPNGFPQLVFPGNVLVEGNPAAPVATAGAIRTGHAFLDDIAHSAAPLTSSGTMKTEDEDTEAGIDDGLSGTYDDELLGAHYITGDGRGNENIGLTAVHHVFHSEHNRLAQQVKDVILETGDLAFLAEWLRPGTAPASFPATAEEIAALQWNGERVFQAAKFGTEMQYQHLVFEEFARKIQPTVNVFDAYEVDINPAIVAEFAHTVYRFGHSMLNETVDRLDAEGNVVEGSTGGQMGLIEAFLNPLAYAERETEHGVAAGEIVRGMTRQVGNEIDEFVTEALRNNLLGLPLDLAAINLARGRDAGIPSLNAARREFFAGTDGDSQLRPYESWVDFGLAIKHPESLVNFIAAYGLHPTILAATDLAGKRAAALAIVSGVDAPEDAVDFLNSTGDWASGPDEVTTTGLDLVDFWIGGLAEKQMPFGGLLGSTFNFVFETQLEALQDGDRFYYLARTAGMNFFTELEQASFADLVMRNTGTKHLPADVFSTPAHIIERSDPGTWPAGEVIQISNGIRYTGADHVVLGGTDGVDRLFSSEGDDTLYGDEGNDVLEGGSGNDTLLGGSGSDKISDQFGDDVLQGGDGRDTINAGPGIDLVLGGAGNDYLNGGEDEDELFGGRGDDILIGGDSTDEMIGNEGDDWFEGGASGDLMVGDNNDPFALGNIRGNDVFIGGSGTDRMEGEHGDDIFVGGEGLDRHEGMTGYDWMSYALDSLGITADLTLRADVLVPPTPSPDAILDRFNGIEGLSGSARDDVLRGDDVAAADLQLANAEGLDNVLRNDGLITGLSGLLGGATSFAGGNIILGGAGSDTIEGRGGDDIIDGDAYLHVALSARVAGATIVREIRNEAGSSDFDRAVYSDVRASYDIVANGDGSFLVAHARGSQADGTDTVRNIEELVFADQTALLKPVAATGTITIDDTTPTQNQLLFVDAAVADANGIAAGTLQLFWEAETGPGDWTVVGTGTSFQANAGLLGQALRVRASFTDQIGTPETVLSDPTEAVAGSVNQAATGAPSLSDTTPTEGQTLTAGLGDIADADGLAGAVFAFRWQEFDGADWVDIPGATGASFTPAQAQVGQPIRVVASFTDDGGSAEQLMSAPTAVVGDLFAGTNAADAFLGTAGDDVASGLGAADTLTGGDGDDLLSGQGGNDALVGNGGNDTLLGGAGNDQLNAGNGQDVLDGGGGNDVLNGGADADRLVGGAGNDTLVGGGGNDVLVFAAGFGDDLVTGFDFDPVGGQDLLDVTALGIGAGNFAALVAIAQAGADTVITIGANEITLTGVNAGSVTAADFILNP